MAIRTCLGLSPARYRRLLAELVDSEEADAYDPLVIRRLRRRREGCAGPATRAVRRGAGEPDDPARPLDGIVHRDPDRQGGAGHRCGRRGRLVGAAQGHTFEPRGEHNVHHPCHHDYPSGHPSDHGRSGPDPAIQHQAAGPERACELEPGAQWSNKLKANPGYKTLPPDDATAKVAASEIYVNTPGYLPRGQRAGRAVGLPVTAVNTTVPAPSTPPITAAERTTANLVLSSVPTWPAAPDPLRSGPPDRPHSGPGWRRPPRSGVFPTSTAPWPPSSTYRRGPPPAWHRPRCRRLAGRFATVAVVSGPPARVPGRPPGPSAGKAHW